MGVRNGFVFADKDLHRYVYDIGGKNFLPASFSPPPTAVSNVGPLDAIAHPQGEHGREDTLRRNWEIFKSISPVAISCHSLRFSSPHVRRKIMYISLGDRAEKESR